MADQAGQGRRAQLSSRCRRRESPVASQPVSDAATGNWICFSHDSTTNRRGKSDHPRFLVPPSRPIPQPQGFLFPSDFVSFTLRLRDVGGQEQPLRRERDLCVWTRRHRERNGKADSARTNPFTLALPNDAPPSSEASMHARDRRL